MESGRISVRIIAFAAFSAICYFGATAIITVLLAIMVAYLLDPLAGLLRRLHLPKSLSIAISMLIAGVVVALLLSLFIDRAQEFSVRLPRYRTKIQKISRDVRNRMRALEKRSEDLSKTIIPAGPQPGPPATVRVEQHSTLRDFFFRDLGPFYEYMVLLSFFPFLVYFLLAEQDTVRTYVSSLVRSRTGLSHTFVEGTADQIVSDINSKIRGFVVGYLLSTMIIFFAAWILFLAFGVDEASIWAVIFALLNILPFVGAILAVLPPLLIAILQFTSVEQSILFIGICVLLHLIYANWLIPRTTGPRTELSPLIVILAMMYWGFLWGAIGIFLAIPLTASLRSIWLQYRRLQEANARIAPEEMP